eukprot:scaffold149_cov315-Pinguiococcus_pyrenoidosus.AAC.61
MAPRRPSESASDATTESGDDGSVGAPGIASVALREAVLMLLSAPRAFANAMSLRLSRTSLSKMYQAHHTALMVAKTLVSAAKFSGSSLYWTAGSRNTMTTNITSQKDKAKETPCITVWDIMNLAALNVCSDALPTSRQVVTNVTLKPKAIGSTDAIDVAPQVQSTTNGSSSVVWTATEKHRGQERVAFRLGVRRFSHERLHRVTGDVGTALPKSGRERQEDKKDEAILKRPSHEGSDIQIWYRFRASAWCSHFGKKHDEVVVRHLGVVAVHNVALGDVGEQEQGVVGRHGVAVLVPAIGH